MQEVSRENFILVPFLVPFLLILAKTSLSKGIVTLMYESWISNTFLPYFFTTVGIPCPVCSTNPKFNIILISVEFLGQLTPLKKSSLFIPNGNPPCDVNSILSLNIEINGSEIVQSLWTSVFNRISLAQSISKRNLSKHFGSDPHTSAKPPVFINGTHSEVANKI